MSHDRLIADLFPDKAHRQTVTAILSALPPTVARQPDRIPRRRAWLRFTGALKESLMASKFTPLINSLWPGEAGRESRAIAEKFAARFGEMPMASGHVEGWLREGARLDGLILDGAMTRDEAQEALFGFTEIGTAPHVLAELKSWSDGIAAELAAAEAPPGAAPEPPPMPAQPIQARPAAPSPALTTPAGPTRAELQQEIDRHQADMKSAPGSEGWTRYWRGGGSQAYLSALQAIETAPETAAAGTLAGDTAAPAPSQPAAAPPAEPVAAP